MKKHMLPIAVLLMALFACNNEKAEKITIDTLIKEVELYEGKLIETEGLAVHFCGAGEKKLKLKSENGAIVKVVPANLLVTFHAKYNHKKLKVVGRVETKRIESSVIDQVEREKTLLCHIDHTPCIDEDWVKRKKETGVADSLSLAGVKKLRDEMQRTDKDYVMVVSVIAKEIIILE